MLNEASCHEPGNTSTFSAFLPAAEQGWEVQAVSIDTLIDEACELSSNGRVRLLKIDAEGAEYPTGLGDVRAVLGLPAGPPARATC